MARTRLQKLLVLQYAQEGLHTLIGSHPAPKEFPEEIELYKKHLKEVERRIKLCALANLVKETDSNVRNINDYRSRRSSGVSSRTGDSSQD